MSAPIDDGGPAFPEFQERTVNAPPGASRKRAPSGMSLRDWFAGQALAGMLANNALMNLCPEQPLEKSVAESAYCAADAMLAERKRGASGG